MKIVVLIILIIGSTSVHAVDKCYSSLDKDSRASDVNNMLKCLEEKISALQTASNQLKKNRDEMLRQLQQVEMRKSGPIFSSPIEFKSVVKKTGKEEMVLGKHKVCMLAGIAGPGGFDVQCRVYFKNEQWYLLNIDESRGESNACLATCFD